MASIATSRFAVLKIDDDLDSDDNSKGKANKANQQNNQAKKKNKKKKKVDQQKENEELRSLAFGRGGKKSGGGGGGPVLTTNQRPEGQGDQQWQEWKRADKEFTADSYEQDLQQALLLSKLEEEEHKKAGNATPSKDDTKSGASSKSKKKKSAKKDKPAAMSLEEFQTGGGDKKPGDDGSGDGLEDFERAPTTSISEPDPAFFNQVETDAKKIIRKEHIQEEYRKQYVVENARTNQFKDELSKKDNEITKLKKVNKKLEADLKEVKERNQQLCLILAQGEMKGKTNILLELSQLSQVRDELTDEVASLTTELEKERSKVHALTKAQDKGKGGKHSK